MREILFRGKTILDNEWVIGAGVYKSEGHTWIITDDVTKTENRGTGSDAINPETVGQYTGYEKNGSKIFEGDIVRTQRGKLYEIRLYKGAWVVWNKKAKLDIEKWDFLNTFAPKVEVIGNIHDNPELLRTPQNDEVRE